MDALQQIVRDRAIETLRELVPPDELATALSKRHRGNTFKRRLHLSVVQASQALAPGIGKVKQKEIMRDMIRQMIEGRDYEARPDNIGNIL